MARGVQRVYGGLAACYCLHMDVPQIPGRTGQRLAGRACAAGPGDSVGGGQSELG
ncbi:hypothetical protein I79_022527 [Cricetulus griseus]|uniref:Uncharacterized protein n=1 Tax=Cricetulus griseus TaxID=10029 RepID=G3IFK4_CRIGR|nr:hypothetical protein I79_022527 [Cricetulus griseus]